MEAVGGGWVRECESPTGCVAAKAPMLEGSVGKVLAAQAEGPKLDEALGEAGHGGIHLQLQLWNRRQTQADP